MRVSKLPSQITILEAIRIPIKSALEEGLSVVLSSDSILAFFSSNHSFIKNLKLLAALPASRGPLKGSISTNLPHIQISAPRALADGQGETLTQKPTRRHEGPLEILEQNIETLLITPFSISLVDHTGRERGPFYNPTKPSMSDNSECCPAKISVTGIYGFLFVVILKHLSNLS